MDRFFVEMRSAIDGNHLVGHAAVFDQIANLGRAGYEQISRSAFDNALQTSDCFFLFNHDPNMILGRQSSGTLQLTTDNEGLAFRCELPDTQLGNDIRTLVSRGDLSGGSFGFVAGEDKITRAADGGQMRTHTNIKSLLDCSLVTYPAYEGTNIALRSMVIVPTVNVQTQLLLARHARKYAYERGT